MFDLRIFKQEIAMMKQPTPAFQSILEQQVNEVMQQNPHLEDTLGVGE